MKNKSLSDKAYDFILEKLFSGNLIPGDIINRREIAAEIGVSISPVLEAMVRLESEGFIETIPRKGTQVKPLRKEHLKSEVLVREALECQAARMCCGSRAKENKEELRKLAEQADSFEDTDERLRAEVAFHRKIVALIDQNVFLRIFDQIMQRGLFYRINRLLDAHDKEPKNSHVVLLKQLMTPDPDKAEKAMRAHVRSGRKNEIIENSFNVLSR